MPTSCQSPQRTTIGGNASTEAAKAVHVGVRLPKWLLNDFKTVFAVDCASTAILAAARKGLEYMKLSESLFLSRAKSGKEDCPASERPSPCR